MKTAAKYIFLCSNTTDTASFSYQDRKHSPSSLRHQVSISICCYVSYCLLLFGGQTSQRKVVTCYIVRTELVVSNALVVSISNALMFFCKARGHLLNGRLRVSRSSVPLLRFSSFSLFSKVVIHPIACNIHDRFPMVIPMGVGTKSRRCGCGLVS